MRFFKKILSVFLAVTILVGVMSTGVVSAGAYTPSLTVDGFESGKDEYCIRIDGLTTQELATTELWFAVPLYSVVVHLRLTYGNDVYEFLGLYLPVGGTMVSNITFKHNSVTVEKIKGEFYDETSKGGKCGYAFYLSKDSTYLDKILRSNAGTASITLQNTNGTSIWGLDNELMDSPEAVKITPNFKKTDIKESKDISTLKFSKVSDKAYTGKAITPSVTIKSGKTKLKKDKDYAVFYQNNKEVGTASIIIKGRGDYTGTKTINFKILPPKTTLKAKKQSNTKVKLSWSKIKNAEKYEIYYSEDGGKFKKLATVSGTKKSYTCTDVNFKRSDYKFKVRAYDKINGITYYAPFSKTVTVK